MIKKAIAIFTAILIIIIEWEMFIHDTHFMLYIAVTISMIMLFYALISVLSEPE